MPVKKRLPKKFPIAEIRDAWVDKFECGSQLLAGMLQRLGFDPEEDVEAAWREHGRWYLTEGRREGAAERRAVPWALEVFGEP